jgi:hypothetical protein
VPSAATRSSLREVGERQCNHQKGMTIMNERKIACILFCFACSSAVAGCGAPNEKEMIAPGATAEDSEQAPEVSPGIAQQALYQKCESVRIEVANQREEADGSRPDIKVTSLEFYNRRTGWHTEAVNNQVIRYNASYPFVEDLGNTQDDVIDSWIVNFRYDLGNGWSSIVDDFIDTPAVTCVDGLNVDLTVTEN